MAHDCLDQVAVQFLIQQTLLERAAEEEEAREVEEVRKLEEEVEKLELVLVLAATHAASSGALQLGQGDAPLECRKEEVVGEEEQEKEEKEEEEEEDAKEEESARVWVSVRCPQ